MISELRLEKARRDKGPSGVLAWDEDTGEVSGYMADRVRSLAEKTKETGVSFTPLGLYSDKNPLKDKKAMAILLMAMGYIVPEQLRDSYEVSDRDISGAVY
jgi:hypothetical protein